jgi:uncharacterized protein YbjT (DUF2867 family)
MAQRPHPPSASGAALLAGGSGLVGRELAALWPGPGTLHLLLRRAQAAGPHQSVRVVDFGALGALPAAHDAYCCLGTTLKVAGSPAAFRAVDLDAVLAFARAARAAGVQRLAVVSALGADARSRSLYNRTKGEMEQALRDMGFGRLVIARPSLLTGERQALGQPARPAEALALALTRPLAPWIPLAWRPIAARTVARAMLRALAQDEPGVVVLESAQLQAQGQA